MALYITGPHWTTGTLYISGPQWPTDDVTEEVDD